MEYSLHTLKLHRVSKNVLTL